MPQSTIEKILEQFGPFIALVCLGAWFLVWKWWPYYTARQKREDEERARVLNESNVERREILTDITHVLKEHLVVNKQHEIAAREVAQGLKELSELIHSLRSTKKR